MEFGELPNEIFQKLCDILLREIGANLFTQVQLRLLARRFNAGILSSDTLHVELCCFHPRSKEEAEGGGEFIFYLRAPQRSLFPLEYQGFDSFRAYATLSELADSAIRQKVESAVIHVYHPDHQFIFALERLPFALIDAAVPNPIDVRLNLSFPVAVLTSSDENVSALVSIRVTYPHIRIRSIELNEEMRMLRLDDSYGDRMVQSARSLASLVRDNDTVDFLGEISFDCIKHLREMNEVFASVRALLVEFEDEEGRPPDALSLVAEVFPALSKLEFNCCCDIRLNAELFASLPNLTSLKIDIRCNRSCVELQTPLLRAQVYPQAKHEKMRELTFQREHSYCVRPMLYSLLTAFAHVEVLRDAATTGVDFEDLRLALERRELLSLRSLMLGFDDIHMDFTPSDEYAALLQTLLGNLDWRAPAFREFELSAHAIERCKLFQTTCESVPAKVRSLRLCIDGYKVCAWGCYFPEFGASLVPATCCTELASGMRAFLLAQPDRTVCCFTECENFGDVFTFIFGQLSESGVADGADVAGAGALSLKLVEFGEKRFEFVASA